MTERRNFYEEHGYLLVADLLPVAEVDAACADIHAIADSLRVRRGSLDASWPGTYRAQITPELDPATFSCDAIHDVQRHSALMTRLVMDPRIINIFVELIGPNVALHHTKYHAKPPRTGAPFPLHQDYPHFPHEAHSMLVGALFLDDTNAANGCLGVVPGSHRQGPLPIVGPEEKYLDPGAYPLDSLTLLPAERGSVLFLNYLTVHGSPPNRSAAPRRTLFIQVRDAADRPTDRSHRSHAQGLMLAGTARPPRPAIV